MPRVGGQVEHLLPRQNSGCGHLTLTGDRSPLLNGHLMNQMNPPCNVSSCTEMMTIYGMMTFVP